MPAVEELYLDLAELLTGVFGRTILIDAATTPADIEGWELVQARRSSRRRRGVFQHSVGTASFCEATFDWGHY